MKATQLDEVCTEDIYDPAEMRAMAEERVGDEQFAKQGFLVGTDPAERIRDLRGIDGTTAICLQLIGDADPLGSIRRYGEEVLPALRRSVAPSS